MLYKKYCFNVVVIIVLLDYFNICEIFIVERIDIEGVW